MRIIDFLSQIDWQQAENREAAVKLITAAEEYLKRVEAHIFQGNEIRADMFMDFSEKQEEISRLDRKRTQAHNQLLSVFPDFLDLLRENTEFDERDYRLDNRTQIADFVSMIAFELTDREPSSLIEGAVRDELAELLYKGEVTFEQIESKIPFLRSQDK